MQKFNACICVIRFNLPLQIREVDPTSAPPSSPVPFEKENDSLNAIIEREEDESFSDDTDAESQKNTGRKYFAHLTRHPLVTPKERFSSEPALPTYETDWSKKMSSSKPHSYVCTGILLNSQSIQALRIYDGEDNAYWKMYFKSLTSELCGYPDLFSVSAAIKFPPA